MSGNTDVSPERDAVLHAAWRAGDHHAAAQLIVRYRSRLVSFGERRLSLSEGEANDLAQDTLLEAWQSEFEVRPEATYWSWLARIARRVAGRKKIERRSNRFGVPVRRITTPWSDECRRRLLQSIEAMNPSRRDVFARLVLGQSTAEIARDLGVNAVDIRMRIYRGRKWMRNRGH